MDPEKIKKHVNVFHNLLIDILRRRELFRIFEENLKNKATKEAVEMNWFISFYITDYTRAQVTDLRKFFETDKNSYKVKFLTESLGNEGIKMEHREIFKHWKKTFEEPSNKLIMHLDQDSERVAKVFKKEQLDQFINDVNTFLDSIVHALRKEGNKIVFDEKYGNKNNDFLTTEAKKEFTEFLKIICS